MPAIAITELADSRLAGYRDLPNHHVRRDSGRFIAEGEKVVERMLAAGHGVESLLVEPELAPGYAGRVAAETPIYVAEKPLLQQICGFQFHRGVLGCGFRPQPPPLDAVLPAPPAPAALLVLAGVQDPTNLGSILRSAAALGVTGVVLGPGCADPYSRRVLRVSMAAVLALPLWDCDDLSGLVCGLRTRQGVEPLATLLAPEAVRLADFEPPKRFALLMGSEGHGLPEELAALATTRLTIPMHRAIDSLNVAVATAVFLYELCARRGEAGRRKASE